MPSSSHRPGSDAPASWKGNLRRTGGHWRDGRWYDLHVERRLPLAFPMLDELVMALPPLPPGALVCDLACGTGNAAYLIAEAYPMAQFVLLDADADVLALAHDKVGALTPDVEALPARLDPDGDDPLPGGPYDVVVATLALHAIIGHPDDDDAAALDRAEAESRYELLLRTVRDALVPGGHLLIGDHVGTLDLYPHLKALDRAGFVDVDCAWRQDDFFVAGGRVPLRPSSER
jgi:SAM-dependent methyltransferase